MMIPSFIWIVVILIIVGILTYSIITVCDLLKTKKHIDPSNSEIKSDSSVSKIQSTSSETEVKSDSKFESLISTGSDYVIKPKCPVCEGDSNNQSVLSGNKDIWNIVCENGHIFNYQYIEETDNYRIVPGLYISKDECKDSNCSEDMTKLVCKLLYASMYYDTINDNKILSAFVEEDIKSPSSKRDNMKSCPVCNKESVIKLDCDGSCSFCENRHMWHRSKSVKVTTELSSPSSVVDKSTESISAYTSNIKIGKCPKCKYNDWRLEQIDILITPEAIKIFEAGRCPRPDEISKN